MKDHVTYDDSHGNDLEFESEIAAIALALKSDPDFSSKVKSTPLSDLPSVLGDEGFTGTTLVSGFVSLLAQAIDEHTVETNGLDIQRLNKMSLHEIESEAPELLDHIIRRISSPGSSEHSSINSIAGGMFRSWTLPGNRSRSQKAAAGGLDTSELLVVGGFIGGASYKILQNRGSGEATSAVEEASQNELSTPKESSTPSESASPDEASILSEPSISRVTFDPEVNVRTIATDLKHNTNILGDNHTFTFSQTVEDGVSPLNENDGTPREFEKTAVPGNGYMNEMEQRMGRMLNALMADGEPYTTFRLDRNGDQTTFESDVKIGSTNETTLPVKGILKNRRLDLIAESDESKITREIGSSNLSDGNDGTGIDQINPARPRANQVLDVDDVESVSQEGADAVQDSELKVDNTVTSITSDTEDVIA
jgi:hypothetical protein